MRAKLANKAVSFTRSAFCSVSSSGCFASLLCLPDAECLMDNMIIRHFPCENEKTQLLGVNLRSSVP